ncbi:hypothetical protein TPHA_0K01150 [Tetrapisispora phaffii CBS 4417]|uniref:Uncharacterized protein n=1 Tax=Tetrapisispora phaffii (strain ATCC 24235 / CBS 4417 / NBRC 1672 / NRRL Y-8282 / UCD 70-5) TaxID=1071381 RepID=G8BZC1_TETPH|nr:hypothetical protein TPHA_0K01150 [Tetrapisispora phaffii CBS 4417]CCE65249.1 hypothetical protein TPHA_0K01150 [Tetrapisispora phaffii CBS 4417]
MGALPENNMEQFMEYLKEYADNSDENDDERDKYKVQLINEYCDNERLQTVQFGKEEVKMFDSREDISNKNIQPFKTNSNRGALKPIIKAVEKISMDNNVNEELEVKECLAACFSLCSVDEEKFTDLSISKKLRRLYISIGSAFKVKELFFYWVRMRIENELQKQISDQELQIKLLKQNLTDITDSEKTRTLELLNFQNKYNKTILEKTELEDKVKMLDVSVDTLKKELLGTEDTISDLENFKEQCIIKKLEVAELDTEVKRLNNKNMEWRKKSNEYKLDLSRRDAEVKEAQMKQQELLIKFEHLKKYMIILTIIFRMISLDILS